MFKCLLDTVTYIDLQRARTRPRNPQSANTLRHATNYINQYGKLTLSTLTVMELAAGITNLAHRLQAFKQQVTATFDIIGFNEDAACIGGEIYARLEASGQRIGVADTAIAAIALPHGLTLVTANDRHFQRVVNLGYSLTLENWRNS